jgi:translation initiation factor IF-3
MDGVSHI